MKGDDSLHGLHPGSEVAHSPWQVGTIPWAALAKSCRPMSTRTRLGPLGTSESTEYVLSSVTLDCKQLQ